MSDLRLNDELKLRLGDAGMAFLASGVQAINRLLPHVEVTDWKQDTWKLPGGRWSSSARTELNATVSFGAKGEESSWSMSATVRRRKVKGLTKPLSMAIDVREHDICNLVAVHLSGLLTRIPGILAERSARHAVIRTFDETVVAAHIQKHHKLELSVASVLDAMHAMSEQSYENKALTFGCLLDPKKSLLPEGTMFPGDLLQLKKYKALSDGFRTAYLVSKHGAIVDFVDLEKYVSGGLTGSNHYPDWTGSLASASRGGRCGIALSRQGDILIFDEGTLRFTYRFGQWQYWNHAHLIRLLRDRASASMKGKLDGNVVGATYRAALDVSFRRSGGLFVVLDHAKDLHEIVGNGDAVGDASRGDADSALDAVVANKHIQYLPRSVLVELAALDGAIVLQKSGEIVAYGAVLRPRRSGKLKGSEGSRTKAAIGASLYGLAVKVSSDGEISFYREGQQFLHV